MKIRKIAAISLLALSSFAANEVTPSKSEFEAMYDKAFREFEASNYEQSLQDLDAIDARQPDLAESQNLRGVILMRQKDYPGAEKSLQKATAADPKFWNARFNLAEIPFLEKSWAEARKRFQELLSSNAAELQGAATQLIQYKILITYLMEGKEDMVPPLVAKLELAPETPALHYANAAIALDKKDQSAAEELLTTAEKNFSPQLNKLFAESLYEVGWLEKPAGERRAALELNSAAEQTAKTKEFAKARLDEAEQALQQRDLTAARRLVEEADVADPNQPAVINLRGEILLEEKEWNQAENEFKKAARLDPNFRDAQYNLAQIPFKRKDYAQARDRFEALFSSTTGTDKDKAAQLIKYKIYLTYLLDGKEARAQKLMEQFQFTGDTPALYYAQAAWEFQRNNPIKANDWVSSARKIYSPALNSVFSDVFYDLGWINSAGPGDAAAANAIVEATPADQIPAAAIEPTPIAAATALAQDHSTAQSQTLVAQENNGPLAGTEATTSSAAQPLPVAALLSASALPNVEPAVGATASPATATPVLAAASEKSNDENATATKSYSPGAPVSVTSDTSTNPVTALAPAWAPEWLQPTMSDALERFSNLNTLIVAGLLLAALIILAWVIVPEIRRRNSRVAVIRAPPVTDAAADDSEVLGEPREVTAPVRLAGGPPKVSLQLRASAPAMSRAVTPQGRNGRPATNGHHLAGAPSTPTDDLVAAEPVLARSAETFDAGVAEPDMEPSIDAASGIQAPIEGATSSFSPTVDEELIASDFVAPPTETPAAFENDATFEPSSDEEAARVMAQTTGAFDCSPPASESLENNFIAAEESAAEPETDERVFVTPAESFAGMTGEPVFANSEPATADYELSAGAVTQESAPAFHAVQELPEEPVDAPPNEKREEVAAEPVRQGQPVPYLTSAEPDEEANAEVTEAEPQPEMETQSFAAAGGAALLAGIGTLRHSLGDSDRPSHGVSIEPTPQQSTTLEIMPETIQTMPTPAIRNSPNGPMTGGTPPSPQGTQPMPRMAPAAVAPLQSQPGGAAMQTAVQLTFSFEIASLQLTPAFKMGALQLKPASKVVTMRLAPSQHPQPAMNLQVTFEIVSVQLQDNAIGMIRLRPSQQQHPGLIGNSSFKIGGLQLVSGAEAAPVQLTPSQQGQSSVHVIAPFQIATVEFSSTFEIASLVLNATSKDVSVRLPGAGPIEGEGAPVFEVSGVQLAGDGEIGLMQLVAQGSGAQQNG